MSQSNPYPYVTNSADMNKAPSNTNSTGVTQPNLYSNLHLMGGQSFTGAYLDPTNSMMHQQQQQQHHQQYPPQQQQQQQTNASQRTSGGMQGSHAPTPVAAMSMNPTQFMMTMMHTHQGVMPSLDGSSAMQQQQSQQQQQQQPGNFLAHRHYQPFYGTPVPAHAPSFPSPSPAPSTSGHGPITLEPKPVMSQSGYPYNFPFPGSSYQQPTFSNDCVMPKSQQQAASAQENAAEQIQLCVDVIQQALHDPKFASAGNVLLQAIQASSTYMNTLMNNHPSGLPQGSADQVPSKTLSSDDFAASKVMAQNQEILFLRNDVSPVERQERASPIESRCDDDLWKMISQFDDDNYDDCDSTSESVFPSPIASHMSAPLSTAQQLLAHEHITLPFQVRPSTPPEPQSPTTSMPIPTKSSTVTTAKNVPARAACGKKSKASQPRSKTVKMEFAFKGSPQEYLSMILKDRGYSSEHFKSTDAGYRTQPSKLQVASFGTAVVKAVNASDIARLSSLLSCGLSPTPCNSFGDGIVHLVCKRANYDVFKCLWDYGGDIQVCDSFGRTPLHHVAWAGMFCPHTAEAILDSDLNQLFAEDERGQCPLQYVRKDDWSKWIDFLMSKLDTYWPIGRGVTRRPPLPKEMRVRTGDEPTAISIDLATQVASGVISPEEVATMDEMTRKLYKKSPPPSS